MALRVEVKAKLLISNDNSSNPTDIAFNSGDKSDVNTDDFAEATSKVLKLAPSAADEEVDLDNIASVRRIMILTDAEQVSVTLVPTGAVLADCTAIPLEANCPFVMGTLGLVKVYVSNGDGAASATVKIGAAGN